IEYRAARNLRRVLHPFIVFSNPYGSQEALPFHQFPAETEQGSPGAFDKNAEDPTTYRAG
ncbi:MAG: hypothetical protein WCC92_18020, partial [Candidatus Korobacteraceae bacterium]